MALDPVLVEKIQSFDLADYRPIFKRELELGDPLSPKAGNMATVITGMRRSGKTYRMFQAMGELIEGGIAPDRIVYFNFEDNRLDPVTARTGDAMIETLRSLRPSAMEQGVYLFLDELQEMDGWGKWLRRIIDTTRSTIYVTGSSSKMLSAEYSTELRGRSVEYVLYPYSFREYVKQHHPRIDVDARGFSAANRVALQDAFRQYLRVGGFPAVQGLPQAKAVSALQGYVQRVVARDVIERHGVRNSRAVTAFALKTMALSGRPLSLRKVANEISSSRTPVGRETLADVLGFFEESFLVLGVGERSRALVQGNSPTKAYPIDPGLARANAPASARDDGQSLECAVCVELSRRLPSSRFDALSYVKTRKHGYEVDFVVGDALLGDEIGLFQVTASLSDEKTAERETRALFEAMEEYGVDRSTIIVGEGEERVLERDGKTVECVPAWMWFLGR